MKGYALFRGGDNYEIAKYIDQILKSSPELQGHFQPNLIRTILEWRGIKVIQMKGHAFFQEARQ